MERPARVNRAPISLPGSRPVKHPVARKAPAPPKAKTAPAPSLTWWNVVASREVLGGEGACRRIEPRGYSELSTNPGASLGALDFAALGDLPCLTGLYIRNPANGKVVGAVKQDKGAGSSFHPVMGLYPQTLRDLGLDTQGGRFNVQIRRQDGRPLHPAHGTTVVEAGGLGGGPTTQPEQQAYFNPLKYAHVTASRIDQGVDYSGSGYLVAIADGVVVSSVKNGSGWEGEGWLMYKITQPGPLENVFIYYAEGIDPVVSDNEPIRGGARVADLRSSMPHGIELGFAAGYGEDSYYRYHDGNYVEGTATRPGIAFNNLVHRLGGPSGHIEGAVVGKFPEYMQSGEPSADITLQTTTPGTGQDTGLPVDVASGAAVFDFSDSIYSAFVQLQRGATQAHSHSHAARQWALKQTYVKKAD